MHQKITRFKNMSNSTPIFFLVKDVNGFDTEFNVILKGVELIGVTNGRSI